MMAENNSLHREEVDNASQRRVDLVKLVFQLFHLVLAAAILLIGIVEFSVEPSIFDVFGRENYKTFPDDDQNTTRISSKSLGHILDAPILFLFLIYFLSVLWMKCNGMFAWVLTASQVLTILLYLGVNAGLSKSILDWRYFSTRAVTIILDVLILSFAWTVIVVTLLHIRGWFPFKVKKYRDIPYPQRSPVQKLVVIIWNFVALYMVLSLCFLIWFSKLYMSWACVRHSGEILLMCQFTNMVQCWPCDSHSGDHCNTPDIKQCIGNTTYEQQIRCISPLYLADHFESAFCVFNYNIGPFTFVTVFSYVGGIYFFMRTVLNAMVKCLFSILFVTIHFVIKVVKKDSYERIDPESVSVNNDLRESSEDTESAALAASSDPRVSLLGPLPHYYSGVSNKSSASKKSKYI